MAQNGELMVYICGSRHLFFLLTSLRLPRYLNTWKRLEERFIGGPPVN